MTVDITPEAEVARARATATGCSPLDAVEVLASAATALAARREGELAELRACASWADLHAADPRDEPGYRATPGAERLVGLGGEGTPRVRDLALLELGIALCRHPVAVRAMTADALDLRHRLPRTWSHVMDGDAETWVARKVAAMSRAVPAATIGQVDAAVASAITGLAPSRLLAIAEAAVVLADPAGHRAVLAAARVKRYVTLARAEDTGLRTLIARLTSGDAIYLDATLERVADILARRRATEGLTEHSRDRLRSHALGWLARPAELMVLLVQHDPDPATSTATSTAEPTRSHPTTPGSTANTHAAPAHHTPRPHPSPSLSRTGSPRCPTPSPRRHRSTLTPPNPPSTTSPSPRPSPSPGQRRCLPWPAGSRCPPTSWPR